MITPTPHSLSDSQVKAYEDDGFIVMEDVFSETEVETLREAESFQPIQSALEEGGIQHQTVHLLTLTKRHQSFLQLAHG